MRSRRPAAAVVLLLLGAGIRHAVSADARRASSAAASVWAPPSPPPARPSASSRPPSRRVPRHATALPPGAPPQPRPLAATAAGWTGAGYAASDSWTSRGGTIELPSDDDFIAGVRDHADARPTQHIQRGHPSVASSPSESGDFWRRGRRGRATRRVSGRVSRRVRRPRAPARTSTWTHDRTVAATTRHAHTQPARQRVRTSIRTATLRSVRFRTAFSRAGRRPSAAATFGGDGTWTGGGPGAGTAPAASSIEVGVRGREKRRSGLGGVSPRGDLDALSLGGGALSVFVVVVFFSRRRRRALTKDASRALFVFDDGRCAVESKGRDAARSATIPSPFQSE